MGTTVAADCNQSLVMKGDTAAAKMAAASVFAPTVPKDDPPLPWNTPTSGIFIGNLPLTPSTNSVDQITVACHNSSRRTLSLIPPSLQNGEIVLRPSLDVIREGSRTWNCIAVDYFLGKHPYFHHLNDYFHSIWSAVKEVMATSIGFFFFQFKTLASMEEVIEGGPWLFQGQPIVLQKWEPSMVLRKLCHTQVPVWIKMRHLPIELWTTEGLSIVASGVGIPLYQYAITRACTRLDFARVCVMLDISSKLPKHVVIMISKEDGSETACKLDIEYEWLPPKCNSCVSLGHATKACPMTKPLKLAISIYVQKPKIVRPKQSKPKPVLGQPEIPVPEPEDRNGPSSGRSNKGKDMIIYNYFDVLRLHDEDAESSSRGPKQCSPGQEPDD
ncbi:UNVERIFIED_CONTAM: hypothetical protein Slati_4425600 [Sesamum latifolium]|uniref:DUF4283 domain-containing protein n=1 Tax=Sesamum latifolium TaxID=2727402 RepID=A0AAW2SR34_9LAMI